MPAVHRPILATLGYVVSPERDRVLMVHRNKRPTDLHFGHYNGLGGKLESDEDVVSGIRREIYEESGLVADAVTLRGTISWPGFGRAGEDWFGFIFRIDEWRGEAYPGNDEGTLHWVKIADLESLPMWDSDHLFLPMVFDDDPRSFHGWMPFHAGRMVDWSYVRA
ncbi:8-oxo-dGTP diphosphatase [Luedemannella helvata]|uniref:8-oxo-dGTP diphosphatase n=1 Tax=Luedemannella helvata TaxID=349315 RepID=A0ABP4W338_9ACTN